MTNAEAWCNKSLRPRKPEGSLGRTAQDVHLDSHTAPELCPSTVPIPRSYSFFVCLFLGGGFLFFPFLFFYPSISPVARSQLVFCEVFLYPSTSPVPRSHGWSFVRVSLPHHFTYFTLLWLVFCGVSLPQYFTYFTLPWLVFSEVSLFHDSICSTLLYSWSFVRFLYPSTSPVPRSYIWSFLRFLYPNTPPISRSHGWSLVRFNSLPQYFTYFTLPWLVFSEIFSTPVLHLFHALTVGLL